MALSFTLLLAACSPAHLDRNASSPPSTSVGLPVPQTAPAMVASTRAPASPFAGEIDAPPPPTEPAKEERAVAKSGKTAFVRANSLWLSDRDGSHKRLLVNGAKTVVVNQTANLPGIEDVDIASLAWSPDESRIYFVKAGWATSMALFYVEPSTGRVFFFHDANGYSIIDTCRDAKQIGRVITFEHSYFDIDPGSATDAFFLVDGAEPKTNEQRTGGSGRIGIIGPDDSNVARFLAKTCGIGKAPAAAPAKIPAKLASPTVRCKSFTLERADLAYLDGTKAVRFEAVGGDADAAGHVFGLEDAIQLCDPK